MGTNVNSLEYWDERFGSGDWDAKLGRGQTQLFCRVLLEGLPDWLRAEIHDRRYRVADFGCAEGECAAGLAAAFPASKVVGIDFSASAIDKCRAAFPDIEFRAADFLRIGERFDVVVLSNVLEHFADPMRVLVELLERQVEEHLVLLVPFRERELHAEHLFRFDLGSFPLKVGDFELTHAAYRDCSAIPDNPWYHGQQILVCYSRRAARAGTLAVAAPLFDAVSSALERKAREAAEAASELEHERSERLRLVHELAGARAEARALAERHGAYVRDKEAYIFALRSRLRRAESLGLVAPVRWARRQAKRAVARLGRVGRRVLRPLVPARVLDRLAELGRPGLVEEIERVVTVYASSSELRARYPGAVSLADAERRCAVTTSLVVTVRNEARSAVRWLASLERQRRRPDEVIIVDGGSTDDTASIVRAFAARSPLRVRLIEAGAVNIARGRNLGIEAASNEVIVATDFGCELDTEWLDLLAAPFEISPQTQVAAGWYRASPGEGWGSFMDLVPRLDETSPNGFLPSSRSVAFTKAAWARVGGYPEWLTLTGEDTYFSQELKRACPEWAFVPEAQVVWRAPRSLRGNLLKAYRWSQGDGEAGLFPGAYASMLRTSSYEVGGLLAATLAISFASRVWGAGAALALLGLGALVLASRGIRLMARATTRLRVEGLRAGLGWTITAAAMRWSRLAGFHAGFRRRSQVLSRMLGERGRVVYLLSGVPLTDSGGGQRAAQLAHAFLRAGDAVVFINRFPSYESVRLGISVAHPLLYTLSLEELDLERFLEARPHLSGRESVVLVEFPLAEFAELAERLHDRGARVIYDCIDDWTTSLGGDWYSPAVERRVLDVSDALVATAAPLAQRLTELTGRPVTLVPNAVNTSLFRHADTHPRPADLVSSGFVIIYIGALWGHWFDWGLLEEVARAFPDAAVVVVGDYHGQCKNPPTNVHFLGLKKQSDLPAYLAHADVAIVPWSISGLTDTVNPLKVYEYLAMAKPVVAPRIKPLEGLPYVLLSADHREFIDNIRRARTLEIDEAVLDEFIAANDWDQRVRALRAVSGSSEGVPSGARESVDRRA